MIRAAKKEDLLQIDRLGYLFNKEIQGNSPLNQMKTGKYNVPKSPSKSAYYEYLTGPNKIFVVEEQGQIVGFVSGRILKQKEKKVEKYGKLDDLYLLKHKRGTGLASSLVEQILKWFGKNKCQYAVLFASPKKPIAKYYQKIGFETVYNYMCKKL
jgi:ribosomal protein S18 acetylase RimI-like enzyme